MSIIEDLKEALDLIGVLRHADEDRKGQAELLMKIVEKLRPYIHKVSTPVTLAWGVVCDYGEWSRFTPESKFSVSDLSSSDGILLWSPLEAAGDKLWLLSSGKFLYLKTLESKSDSGVGWSHDSWVGEPTESENPSMLSQVLIDIVCDNLMDAVLMMLVTVSEVDEHSFLTLLSFPQRYILNFLRRAPCSATALAAYSEKFNVKEYLLGVLDETENRFTVSEVLEILNKMCGWREMLDLIQSYMGSKPDSPLRPVFEEWRARVMKFR